MAADIVQTLFGVSPEAYQQKQADLAGQRALDMAQLDPFQRASYNIGRGGYQLAGALGGALGGQDPELQKISARNSIAKQINFSDLNSISQGVRMLSESGDTQGAMQLQQILLSQQAKLASIGKDEAAGQASLAAAKREKAPPPAPTTNDLTNARAIASLAGPEGSSEYITAFNKEYARLTTKEPKDIKDPRFGVDREAVAEEVYGMSFAALTQAQKAAVNKRVEDEQGRKAAAGAAKLTNVLPGTNALVDIPAFRSKVQGTIEPQLKTINATDQALQAIEDSLSTGNFASYRAAQVQFARAISGAGDLSQRELKAAGADPSLLGGTADYLSSLFTSTPTTDTQNKIRTTLEAIRKVAAKKSSTEVEQQRKMALRSPGYSPEAVTEALTFPELAPRVVAPVLGAIGGDLAAQAAAELARRKAAKAK